ncbi:MAG TPA: serine/threonine-protein kinase, partial [Tepidisphaeraceae bacterium]|nr:serine/threonine-protein kinase [Tepidisphaeraceae bacterium]
MNSGFSTVGLEHLLHIDVGEGRVRPSSPLPEFPGLEIFQEIAPGVGGMGVVYKAREVSLDRVVAVKTLKSPLPSSQGLEYFQREARAAARLEHPNILRIFRFEPGASPPLYVMQYLEGARSLDQACAGARRDPKRIAAWFETVARALAYAHSRGIIHRDIKPDNLLVGADDEPYVADFGVAGRIEDPTTSMGPAALVGTPPFIAPEVYAGTGDIGPAVDIYALGVTLYAILAGRLPFVGRTLEDLRQAVLHRDPPLPQELDPSVPEPLQRTCLKAMEREPSARYESAEAMADDLRRFCDGRPVWARPARYQTELRGRLRNHLADIRLWNEQTLIDLRDMDRLARPYHAMLEGSSPWQQLSRRFPWESVALRTSGWLVIIGSILWPAFYWGRLTRSERVWAIGLPALLINLVGWVLRWRGSRTNALIYLSTGALLLPLFCSVVLTEYRLWPDRQSPSRELLASTTDSQRPTAHGYAPTNQQLAITIGVFVVYCAILLAVTSANILGLWLGFGIYLLFLCLLLMAGLKEWVFQHQVARAVVLCTGLSLLFWPAALALEIRPFSRTWAPVLFCFFPIPFVLCMNVLAHYGAVEWLHAEPRWNDQLINLWWMLDGLVFLALGLWAGRSRLSYIRFWGAFLVSLVALHLLGPAH